MGKIIQWDEIKKKQLKELSGINVRKNNLYCQSPVVIERALSDAVFVSFSELFNLKNLVYCLTQLNYVGERSWVVNGDGKIDEGYYHFFVQLKNPEDERLIPHELFSDFLYDGYTEDVVCEKDENYDGKLSMIVNFIIRQAYIYENRMRPRKMIFSDLKTPRLDLKMSDESYEIFMKTGKTFNEIVDMRRMEICRIKHMTTKAVFEFEKALAHYGFFLPEEAIEPYVPIP